MAFRQAFRWRGGDGGWETIASWDDGTNYPGDDVGADYDDVLFDGSVSTAVTGDLDQSGAAAGIRRIITYPKSTNNIGVSGTPLYINVLSATDPSAIFDHEGSGKVYFRPTSFGNVFLRTPGSADDSAAMTTAGVLNHVVVEQGLLSVTASPSGQIAKSLYVCGPYAGVTIASGVVLPATIIVEQGFVDCYADWPSSNQNVIVVGDRGVFRMYGTVPDSNRVIVLGNGKFIYEPATALTSSHNPDVWIGGTLDMTDSLYDVEFNTLIVGPDANLRGSAIQVANQPSPLGAYIDARKPYP